MYFPYFYGRRMELLALRDLATPVLSRGHVVPVIEAVKADPSDLVRCVIAVVGAGCPIYIVANPSSGDFSDVDQDDWSERISQLIDSSPLVRPALLVDPNTTLQEVSNFLDGYSDRPNALVVRGMGFSIDSFQEILTENSIVFAHETAGPTGLARKIPASHFVPVEAAFVEQPRNADYENSDFFSDRVSTVEESESPGFSDFGLLPKTFKVGGGQPGAVAIHVSYQTDDGSIEVQHFKSNTTDRNEGDVASKIAEASSKLAQEIESYPDKFVQTDGLRAIIGSSGFQRPTDLATLKRRSIAHHLEFIATILEQ